MTITQVPGVLAGHWTHVSGTTGTTAFLFPAGARGGVFVPGSAAGSRELGALDPTHIAGSIHGICLSGGSAFGLAAADGVQAVLAERGIGFDAGVARVPIVPAAILFDLPVAVVRPDAAAGRAAAEAASAQPLAQGRVGAGAGARVGKAGGLPAWGGLGSAAATVGAWTVGAAAAVNAFGCIWDGHQWLGPAPQGTPVGMAGDWRGNTTLVVVATDAPLDRAQATVLARMAAAGLARTTFPAFTPFDGDTVFVAATGVGATLDAGSLCLLGDRAAALVAQAVINGVRAGQSAAQTAPPR